jgi:RNA polymerase sporulation-specific sigma factor
VVRPWAALRSLLNGLLLLAGYITNGSTFPQPLSAQEEADCLAQLGNGDEHAR